MPERSRLQLLQEVRQRHGGRLSRCNVHDPNVSTSNFDWADAPKPGPPTPDRFVHQLKFRSAGRAVVIYASELSLSVQLLADFRLDGTFSVNRVDRVVMGEASQAPVSPSLRWPVFVCGNSSGREATKDAHARSERELRPRRTGFCMCDMCESFRATRRVVSSCVGGTVRQVAACHAVSSNGSSLLSLG